MVFSTQIQAKLAHAKGEVVPEFNSEHPAHPALVHFPIAFNILAWALDILYALTTTVARPKFLTSRFGDDSTLLDMSRLSYFLLCAGLLFTIPAVMSGGSQLMGMISKNGGPWEKDAEGKQTDTMVPRIKIAITHAMVNDVVFVLNIYNWYTRRSTFDHPNIGNVPSGKNMLLSAVLLPMLIAGAKSGANLVYNHGVGLNLGRKKWDKGTKAF